MSNVSDKSIPMPMYDCVQQNIHCSPNVNITRYKRADFLGAHFYLILLQSSAVKLP